MDHWTISTGNQWEISEVGRLSCFCEFFAWSHIVCDRYTSDNAHFTFSYTIWPLSLSSNFCTRNSLFSCVLTRVRLFIRQGNFGDALGLNFMVDLRPFDQDGQADDQLVSMISHLPDTRMVDARQLYWRRKLALLDQDQDAGNRDIVVCTALCQLFW